MNCMDLFERLDAYHSGGLNRLEAEAWEQHLLSCEACRADFRFQRVLRAETAALPRGIAPPADLWHGIGQRIGAKQGTALTDRPGARLEWWQRKNGLAAAAIILMAVTSGLTALLIQRGDQPVNAIATSEFLTTEAAYRHAAEELAATLDSRRQSLGPAAVAVIEHNLQIIDEAIRETQAALAVDPRNQHVAELLWASYEKKIDLLERAAQSVES